MGLSHVMQNNGAAFRKNKDINDFVGKNKMLFVLKHMIEDCNFYSL